MVELEEITPYGIYYLNGKSIQLLEEHFSNDIMQLAQHLTTIAIDSSQLRIMGFTRNMETNICSKTWKDCKVVLCPTKHGWKIQFEGVENAGYIHHLHQVQRLWYSHFQEHLWLPKVKKELPPKPLQVGNTIDTKPFIHNNRTYSNVTITPPRDQEYYITWDSRLLIRASDGVIWRVSDKSPLFSHAGRNWGLELEHGRATEEERVKAAKWLKKLLQES